MVETPYSAQPYVGFQESKELKNDIIVYGKSSKLVLKYNAIRV